MGLLSLYKGVKMPHEDDLNDDGFDELDEDDLDDDDDDYCPTCGLVWEYCTCDE